MTGVHHHAEGSSQSPLDTEGARLTEFSPATAGDRIQRSTSRSRDLTGDGWPDILAREPGVENGALWAYTHSRSFSGTTTFSQKTMVGRYWNSINWVAPGEFTGDEPVNEVAEAPADLIARSASDGALLVYPHSGSLNGLTTWGAPVVIGTGWNGMLALVTADVTSDGFDDILAYDASDNLWVYPHTGRFNGRSTLAPRVLVRTGRMGWLMATEWSRENPDLITAYSATGEMVASPHNHTFDGKNTFSTSSKVIAQGVFAGSSTTSISLNDLNGNGSDDVLKRLPNGELWAYPFLGWNQSTVLGDPVLVGRGWHVMDLIT